MTCHETSSNSSFLLLGRHEQLNNRLVHLNIMQIIVEGDARISHNIVEHSGSSACPSSCLRIHSADQAQHTIFVSSIPLLVHFNKHINICFLSRKRGRTVFSARKEISLDNAMWPQERMSKVILWPFLSLYSQFVHLF